MTKLRAILEGLGCMMLGSAMGYMSYAICRSWEAYDKQCKLGGLPPRGNRQDTRALSWRPLLTPTLFLDNPN